jgi:molybdenum cofactor cytidylyltransferase
MNLRTALRLDKPTCVAFVGAGGKTTAMFRLARELPPPVIVTTTTHMGTWQLALADRRITDPDELASISSGKEAVIAFTGKNSDGDRVLGLNAGEMDNLHRFVVEQGWSLLIEADGARQLPLKAPGLNEPVIPSWVDNVVAVAGLTGLYKPLNDAYIHRSQVFSQISDLALDEPVGEESLTKVLLDPNGGLKSIPDHARKIIFLNQADNGALMATANRLTPELLKGFDAALIGRLFNEPEKEVVVSREPIAGVILAAGDSTRFGRPKQELMWYGKTFLENVIRTAILAELGTVCVILSNNAYSHYITNINNPILFSAINTNSVNGQSSSIRAGIQALPANTGGVVFLLCDQPQIPAQLIRDLINRHAESHAPIIAPFVGGRRANPVLFDRCTFPDLLTLEGDMGGRAFFSKYPIDYIPWNDENILLDVDTPEDYSRLLEIE